jgi:asparagine N-glycosylation enzyme membrane subunit Stt3
MKKKIWFPRFEERDNNTLIETQRLYNTIGILNATFIFKNIFPRKPTLYNEETGHSKQNNMSQNIKRAWISAFFSAETQNRQHGGKTGAEFILKTWSITYYKMPMIEQEHKPRFIFSNTKYSSIVNEYDDNTNKYNTIKETTRYNKKTEQYETTITKIIYDKHKKKYLKTKEERSTPYNLKEQIEITLGQYGEEGEMLQRN